MLITTDDARRAEALRRTFEHHGHAVDVALSGAQRRRVIHRRPPAIAVVSLRRSDARGDRLVQELKANGSARVILVITSVRQDLTSVDVLRKAAGRYVRTASITVNAWEGPLWTWMVETSVTLCLQGADPAPRRER